MRQNIDAVQNAATFGGGIRDAGTVLNPRTVQVAIFDLTGRRVHLLREEEQVAGRVALEWNGRDHTGGLVAPGNYVLHIEVSGDAHTDQVSRIVSVAY